MPPSCRVSQVDRRKVLVQMTAEGQQRTWTVYQPLVEEGSRRLARSTVAELELMRKHLEAIRELTGRHRARLEAGDR